MLTVVLAGLVYYYVVVWSKRKGAQPITDKAIGKLMDGYSRSRIQLRFILFGVAIIFLCLAAANPQLGGAKELVKAKNSDVVVALDVSKSMYATDLQPNRLERARSFIKRLLDQLDGCRVGFVIFAGDAYIQVPLTTDIEGLLIFVRNASPRSVPKGGSNIAAAIEQSVAATKSPDAGRRILVLLSDGEDHEGGAESAAERAKDEGLTTFTIGVGSSTPTPLQVANEDGVVDYIRDEGGNIVQSAMSPEMLSKVAAAGGGKYFSLAEDSKAITELRQAIDNLQKREFRQTRYKTYHSYFQIPLFIGIVLLVLESLISYRRRKSTT